MSIFESGASCGGRAMFSADSGPKSHACAPRSCQSKQFSQLDCAGSSGRKTSPAFDGARDMNEKLFCQTRGCLSEQVAAARSTGSLALQKCAARRRVPAPKPGALPAVFRTPTDAIWARGGRRAPNKNDPRGRGADATPSATLYLDATRDAIAATGRDAIDARTRS